MMHPDLHHALMSIMKYGSLVLALSFAGKIAMFAVRRCMSEATTTPPKPRGL